MTYNSGLCYQEASLTVTRGVFSPSCNLSSNKWMNLAPKGGPHGRPRCRASRAAVRAALWHPSGWGPEHKQKKSVVEIVGMWNTNEISNISFNSFCQNCEEIIACYQNARMIELSWSVSSSLPQNYQIWHITIEKEKSLATTVSIFYYHYHF